jgi:hypothetical protein
MENRVFEKALNEETKIDSWIKFIIPLGGVEIFLDFSKRRE